MNKAIRALVPVLLTLAVGACGEATTVGTGRSTDRPTGPDDVVVQVRIGGGLPPLGGPEPPRITVLGDGTIIRPGPRSAGQAITPLQSTKVEAGRVDALVQLAGRLGLLKSPLEFGQPPGADTAITYLTVAAGGSVHRHAVDDLEGHTLEDDPGAISRTERSNRKAVRTFLAALDGLPPGEQPWIPRALAVYVRPEREPSSPPLEQESRPTQPWPLSQPPATSGPRCSVVEGNDVQVLLDALQSADPRTRWIIGGVRYDVFFTPVLPGQGGCSR